jgi:hypothetical protein
VNCHRPDQYWTHRPPSVRLGEAPISRSTGFPIRSPALRALVVGQVSGCFSAPVNLTLISICSAEDDEFDKTLTLRLQVLKYPHHMYNFLEKVVSGYDSVRSPPDGRPESTVLSLQRGSSSECLGGRPQIDRRPADEEGRHPSAIDTQYTSV